jgi:hypothetical protein
VRIRGQIRIRSRGQAEPWKGKERGQIFGKGSNLLLTKGSTKGSNEGVKSAVDLIVDYG